MEKVKIILLRTRSWNETELDMHPIKNLSDIQRNLLKKYKEDVQENQKYVSR